ncbi:MAG: hypothetical protein ACR2FM_05570 [Candidatus Saccharimonadales bacterium]
MNLTLSIKRTTLSALAITTLMASSLSGVATAAVAYDPNGTPTAKTPIFNQFYNVPNGVGNEADFVRVKPKAGTNADYVNAISAACAANEVYTVRTYVHNGADPAYNTQDNASAVARNTVLKMTAPLNTPAAQFEFKSTISASNAASLTDNGFVTCNAGKQVKLTLVPSSVQTYSKPLNFQTAPDSAVNGSLKIGSRTQGSGEVFACWDDRVIVTYDVKVVEEIKTTPPPATTTPPVTTPPATPTEAPKPPAAPPAPPATLPATGPVGIGLMATAVTGISSLGYYLTAARRKLL